jgi:hypothetical protein
MDIEDTIKRESYRDFLLTQFRQGDALATRWQITRKESGMSRSFGFFETALEARRKIDDLLNEVTPLGGPGRSLA